MLSPCKETNGGFVDLHNSNCEVISMRNNQSNRFGRNPLLIKLSGIPLALLLCGSVFAQPVNDDCSSATVIPGAAPDPVYTDSVDATNATLDPADPLLS